MIKSTKPVVAIAAVRTGAGKSQTTRKVCENLKELGLKVSCCHPSPTKMWTCFLCLVQVGLAGERDRGGPGNGVGGEGGGGRRRGRRGVSRCWGRALRRGWGAGEGASLAPAGGAGVLGRDGKAGVEGEGVEERERGGPGGRTGGGPGGCGGGGRGSGPARGRRRAGRGGGAAAGGGGVDEGGGGGGGGLEGAEIGLLGEGGVAGGAEVGDPIGDVAAQQGAGGGGVAGGAGDRSEAASRAWSWRRRTGSAWPSRRRQAASRPPEGPDALVGVGGGHGAGPAVEVEAAGVAAGVGSEAVLELGVDLLPSGDEPVAALGGGLQGPDGGVGALARDWAVLRGGAAASGEEVALGVAGGHREGGVLGAAAALEAEVGGGGAADEGGLGLGRTRPRLAFVQVARERASRRRIRRRSGVWKR